VILLLHFFSTKIDKVTPFRFEIQSEKWLLNDFQPLHFVWHAQMIRFIQKYIYIYLKNFSKSSFFVFICFSACNPPKKGLY